MYCPGCGKENAAEQKFCRSCGLSLEKTAQSLAEQLPALELDKKLRDRRRRLDRWLAIVAALGIAGFVGAILWAIIYKIIILKGEVMEGSLFLAFILGIVLFALLALYRASLDNAGKRQSPPPALKQPADTAELLGDSHLEPVPSVTERTTELLGGEKKRTPR